MQDVPANLEGGHQENSMLRHEPDRLGVLIQESTMLEGIYPRFECPADPIDPMRVSSHLPTELPGFLHQRLDFIFVEMRGSGHTALDQHRAGHADLDQVRFMLDLLAHRFADLIKIGVTGAVLEQVKHEADLI